MTLAENTEDRQITAEFTAKTMISKAITQRTLTNSKKYIYITDYICLSAKKCGEVMFNFKLLVQQMQRLISTPTETF